MKSNGRSGQKQPCQLSPPFFRDVNTITNSYCMVGGLEIYFFHSYSGILAHEAELLASPLKCHS